MSFPTYGDVRRMCNIFGIPIEFLRRQRASWDGRSDKRLIDFSRMTVFSFNAASTALPARIRTSRRVMSSRRTILNWLKIGNLLMMSKFLAVISHLCAFRKRPVRGKESIIAWTSLATPATFPSRSMSSTNPSSVRASLSVSVDWIDSQNCNPLRWSPCCEPLTDIRDNNVLDKGVGGRSMSHKWNGRVLAFSRQR